MGKSGPSKLQERGIYPNTSSDPNTVPILPRDMLDIVSQFGSADELVDNIVEDLKKNRALTGRVQWERFKTAILDFAFLATYSAGTLAIIAFAHSASHKPDYERDPVYQSFVQALYFLAAYLAFSFRDFSPPLKQRLGTRLLISHFRKRSSHALNTVNILQGKPEP